MNQKLKRLIIGILIVSLSLGVFAGCGKKDDDPTQAEQKEQQSKEKGDSEDQAESEERSEPEAEDGSFWSDEPLEFDILYNDNPDYPYQDDWLLWDAIKEATNVTLNPIVVPLSDYEEKRSLLISTGEAPEIIPKTYPGQEVPFIPSGVILPVSDYVDQMPNFSKQIEEWDLHDYINTIKQKDGKYYVLPGLHEVVDYDYSYAMRLDILEENDIPIPDTYDEFYDVLKKLKELYPDTYPFSDRFEFKSTLNVAAPAFGVQAGWGAGNGMYYYRNKDEFGFYPITDDYKEFLAYFNKLVTEGLLDPESFTQEDEMAIKKFTTEKSFVINANSQNVVSYRESMDKTLGEGKYEVAKILPPAGPKGSVIYGNKLENGIMITSKAKEDPNFDKMLKFVDWLWYSEEGKTLTKWGVEGVTYKEVDGNKELMPDVKFQTLNPSGTKDLRKDFGFSGGVFVYGGSKEMVYSMLDEEEVAFRTEVAENKEALPPAPPVLFDEDQREQANLISQPLMDYVEQMTLKFILGDASLDSDWDAFVKACKDKGCDDLTTLTNDVYNATKDALE